MTSKNPDTWLQGTTKLNPGYTFDEFVSGPSNKLALEVAMVVADNPGGIYNPLCICGGSGLGKTHLLNAIKYFFSNKYPDKSVYCTSSEKFMCSMINAIRNKKMEQFRERTRTVDLLLIDDIPFLADRPATQEEFFNVFNELFDAQKQIVMTSDQLPSEIFNLEERLRSRFEGGLVVEIQPPDLETKQNIIKKLAQDRKVELSDDVINALTSIDISDIRRLQGILLRLAAYSYHQSIPVTIQMTKEVLKDV